MSKVTKTLFYFYFEYQPIKAPKVLEMHILYQPYLFTFLGSIPIYLQIMLSMTSSAPPAMEVSLISLNNLKSARYYNSPNPDLYILLTRTSLVKPIPPQN